MEKLDKGKKGEDQALQFLMTQGYQLITRNYTSLNAEIDLIVQKENVLVFVEVRVKANADYGYPEQSLTKAKINAIKRGAATYLSLITPPEKIRFDMISILEYPRWELTHFEDAFF